MVADALSQRPDLESDPADSKLDVYSISVAKPVWLEEVMQGYENDTFSKKIMEQLKETGYKVLFP